MKLEHKTGKKKTIYNSPNKLLNFAYELQKMKDMILFEFGAQKGQKRPVLKEVKLLRVLDIIKL